MGIKKNQNEFDFNSYLKTFKTAKSSDFTHTSLGPPYGSYYIQAEDYETFLDNYIESLENGENHHLTEQGLNISKEQINDMQIGLKNAFEAIGVYEIIYKEAFL